MHHRRDYLMSNTKYSVSCNLNIGIEPIPQQYATSSTSEQGNNLFQPHTQLPTQGQGQDDVVQQLTPSPPYNECTAGSQAFPLPRFPQPVKDCIYDYLLLVTSPPSDLELTKEDWHIAAQIDARMRRLDATLPVNGSLFGGDVDGQAGGAEGPSVSRSDD
ncbi:hypothetical protein EVJ58_g808 [Rhodofomes roseus]|uniref:Uncharacterized protein n=1 Tax=Rhodofomes roseus TaxID=34475 RepID=A0A4Y9Z4S7_9APHY|nr:hypothetical protein EVJ58_g808 [Rhodofomes roseus]